MIILGITADKFALFVTGPQPYYPILLLCPRPSNSVSKLKVVKAPRGIQPTLKCNL